MMKSGLINIKRRELGMSIFLALIVFTTLLMLAGISLRVSSDEIDISVNDNNYMQARYAAESGLLKAASIIRGERAYSGEFFGTLEVLVDESDKNEELKYALFSVRVSGQKGSVEPGTIVSKGFYRGSCVVLSAGIKSREEFSITKPFEVR